MSNEEKNLEEEEWIDEMLADIKNNAWSGFDHSFIESLEAQFEERGRLTEKQLAALEKVHTAVMDKADRR